VTEAHTWEQSVEKARLALVKTFEGRVEAALASTEQIPFGEGRGGSRDRQAKLAQFALDTGIKYQTLQEYRAVTKWLGKKSAAAEFDAETARYRTGDITSYSLARKGMESKKWATGTLFVAFLDANTPPAPFVRWTWDSLSVHLGGKPTNTGKQTLAIAAGEKVSDDEQHKAAALDHAAEAADEIEQIESKLDQATTAMEAEGVIHDAAPVPSEFDAAQQDIEDMLGPLSRTHQLARDYAQAVRESAAWLERHGDEVVGGDSDDPDDRPERIRDIARDAFQEDLGLIQDALTTVGVGTSLTEGFDALLNGERG